MKKKRTPPILVVFLPLVGSVVFRTAARLLDWRGDSPLAISWTGSFELAGLILGLVAAAVVLCAGAKADRPD